VIPNRIPIEIMAGYLKCGGHHLKDNQGYQTIADYLWSYQYTHSGWDDFALKIDKEIRELMKKIFQDCRENGFFSPRCIYREGVREIVFAQCVEKDKNLGKNEVKPDLCYLCEKNTCAGIDGKGNYKQDKQHCWR